MTYTARINISRSIEDAEFTAAFAKATGRAARSYFNQHIIRTDDGRCWIADEGDYESILVDLEDQIIATVPAGRSDEW